MSLKYSNIDFENCSVEEIQAEISKLENEQLRQSGIDTALKKLLVSSYGVIGSPHFFMYDPKIAETITSQGQDMIKFISNSINRYFLEKWHIDYTLHEQLNVEVVTNIKNNPVIYIATDSCFVSFEEVIKSTDLNYDKTDFVKQIYDLRLKGFLDKAFTVYSKKFNVSNYQFMKLETISQTGILLGKNKYILDVVWEQGDVKFKHLSNVIAKGGELVQKDTPAFVRNKIQDVVKFILDKGAELDLNEITILLKKIKNEYKLQNINDLSFNIKINDYDNYVLEDRISVDLVPNTPIHVRASAIYNYLLNKSKHISRYSFIRKNDTVKYYYTKEKSLTNNVFAFRTGQFPVEFAPEFNIDLMFTKTVLNPINKILKTLDLEQVNENLVVLDRWL